MLLYRAVHKSQCLQHKAGGYAWDNHVQQADMSVPDLIKLAILDHTPVSSPGFLFPFAAVSEEEKSGRTV